MVTLPEPVEKIKTSFACYSLYILKIVKTSSEVTLLRKFLPDTVCQFNSINKNAKLVQEGTHFTPSRAAKKA